jgi:hypothetical protein
LLLCGEKVVYLPQNMRRIAPVLAAQKQENMYLWENKNWPNFQWDEQKINELLVRVRHQQGRLLGMADTLGFDVKSPVVLDAMTSDIIKSSEIEGIALNADDVRSSVAWQLGIDRVGVPSSDRYIEGVVEVMFDAVHHYDEPLTQERLFGWHCALFPNPGRLAHITVGDWRQGSMTANEFAIIPVKAVFVVDCYAVAVADCGDAWVILICHIRASVIWILDAEF